MYITVGGLRPKCIVSYVRRRRARHLKESLELDNLLPFPFCIKHLAYGAAF